MPNVFVAITLVVPPLPPSSHTGCVPSYRKYRVPLAVVLAARRPSPSYVAVSAVPSAVARTYGQHETTTFDSRDSSLRVA